MGTRHLTVIQDIGKEEICCMYGQWDGYPTGHGADLKEFLDGFEILNGYTTEDEEKPKVANGMGCLASQLIGYFKIGRKDREGKVISPLKSAYHLMVPGTRETGEEYIYTIYLPVGEDWYEWNREKKKAELHIKIQSGRVAFFGFPGTPPEDMNILYDGPVKDFDPEKVARR